MKLCMLKKFFLKIFISHKSDLDFGVLKIDMQNAFNLVSRQAILDECLANFPELLPWVVWCYSQHPTLWHPLGVLHSASGVQQGDPLGPLLFSIVLQSILKSFAEDALCNSLDFNCWYIDDGVLAGDTAALVKAVHLLDTYGSTKGLLLNPSKCQLYGPCDPTRFHCSIPHQSALNFDILGAPIGDDDFCASFIEKRRLSACELLSLLPKLCDPQLSLGILKQCASFCKLAHLARCTPPTSAVLELLANFDNDVLHCLEQCTELQLTPMASRQAQLSFRHGGFGLRSLFSHATAAFIASASISLSGAFPPTTEFTHLQSAIAMFNQQVTEGEALTMVSVLLSPPRQHLLSEKVEKLALSSLLHNATTATKARLLAESVPQAHAWLRTVPSPGLGLALEPDETHILLKWWLGLPLCNLEETCPLLF